MRACEEDKGNKRDGHGMPVALDLGCGDLVGFVNASIKSVYCHEPEPAVGLVTPASFRSLSSFDNHRLARLTSEMKEK